jgi:hypothetical protein
MVSNTKKLKVVMSRSNANFISDADFEKKIGVAETIPGSISEEDFNKNIGIKANKGDEESLTHSTDPSRLKAFGRGALEGALDVGRGVEQLYIKGAEKLGILDKGTEDKYRAVAAKNREEYNEIDYIKKHPGYATGGEIAGGVAATLPAGAVGVVSKIPLIAKGGKAALNIARGVEQGAVAGGIQYDPIGTLENRLFNIGVGAAAGGVLPAAGATASRLFRGKNPEEVAKLKELAAENNIDLTVPELRGATLGKTFESIVEKMPGTGYTTFRKKQAQQFQKRAQELTENIGRNIEEPGEQILKSIRKVESERKEEASKLFNNVSRISKAQGGLVNFNNIKNEAKTIIDELKQLPDNFIDDDLVNSIARFANLEDLNFDIARKLRTKLGDEVSKAAKAANMGQASAQKERMLSRLFGAFENDMDTFAEKSGGMLKKAYKEAREFYKEKVVPFKSDELEKALMGDYDKDRVVGAFLKPGREQLASKLIQNVDNKGLEASRAAILNKALEDASQGEFFNPQHFAKEALRLGKANKVVFSEAQRKSLEGFSKLAQAAERASKFSQNPDTGARLVPFLFLGGAAAGMAFEGQLNPAQSDTLKAFGGAILAAKMLHTDAGRKLLTRAANVSPKASETTWNKIFNDALRLIGPVAATQQK